MKKAILYVVWAFILASFVISGYMYYHRPQKPLVLETPQQTEQISPEIPSDNNQELKSLLVKYIMTKNSKMFKSMANIIVENTFKYADKYNINPLTLIFVMDVESDFDVFAISRTGAIGLCQINPNVWLYSKDNKYGLKTIGINTKRELYDPQQNIKAGAYILSFYLKQCMKSDNPYKCALKKYFGGNYNSYFNKIKMASGDWYFFYENNKLKENTNIQEVK